MFGPIAVPAYGLHESSPLWISQFRHPRLHGSIQIKTRDQEKCRDQEDQKPPEQGANHSKFTFVFHPALSLNLGSATCNAQFHPPFPRRPPFASRGDVY